MKTKTMNHKDTEAPEQCAACLANDARMAIDFKHTYTTGCEYARVDPPAAPKCVLCGHAVRVDENGFCLDVVPFYAEHNANDAVRCGCRCASSDEYDAAPAVPDEADKAVAQDDWPAVKSLVRQWLMENGIALTGVSGEVSRSSVNRFKLALQRCIVDYAAQARKEAAQTEREQVWRDAIALVQSFESGTEIRKTQGFKFKLPYTKEVAHVIVKELQAVAAIQLKQLKSASKVER